MFPSISRKLTLVLVAAMAIIVVACSEAEAGVTPTVTPVARSAADQPVSEITESTGRIWLRAPIGDHQTGWATLTETEAGLQVELDLEPSEPVAQPAHVHVGTCDQMGAVEYPLENVIAGHSVTEITGATIEDIASGGHAINVHLSFADFKTFTACGNIPALP
jgi:hypothetical protein